MTYRSNDLIDQMELVKGHRANGNRADVVAPFCSTFLFPIQIFLSCLGTYVIIPPFLFILLLDRSRQGSKE